MKIKIVLMLLVLMFTINVTQAADGDLLWSYTTAIGSTMDMETVQITKEGFIVFTPEDTTYLYILKSDGSLYKTISKGAQAVGLNDPVIDENSNIYSYADDGIVYSWNSDGTSRWNRDLSATGDGVVYDGREGHLYAFDGDTVYCLYSDNGSSVWNHSTGFGGYTVPSISSDTLYISGYGDGVKAIWKLNGTLRWNYTSVINILHTPAISVDETTIYVCIDTYDGATTDAGLLALNATTGAENWFFNATTVYSNVSISYSSPTVLSNENIVFGANAASLFCVYPNGTEKWSIDYNDLSKVFESNVIEHENGNISYVYDGKLYTADANTGVDTILYDTGTVDSRYASVSVDNDGNYYFGVDTNKVYAVEGSSKSVYNQTDYTDGTVPNNFYVWRNQPWSELIYETTFPSNEYSYSSPAIAPDGTVYISSYGGSPTWDGKLYAFYPNLTEKWNYTIGGTYGGSVTVNPDGMVYTYGHDQVGAYDVIYAFYPDGTLYWSYSEEDTDGLEASPVLDDDGYLYVGVAETYIYSFYPAGSLRYKTSSAYGSSSYYSTLSIGLNNNIYGSLYSSNGGLSSLYQNGTWEWNFSANDNGPTCPAISHLDNSVIFATTDGVTSLSKLYYVYQNATEKWNLTIDTTSDEIYHQGVALNSSGVIYIGTSDKMSSISPAGAFNWNYSTGGSNNGFGAVVDSDENILFMDEKSFFYSLDHGGNLIWKYNAAEVVGVSTLLYSSPVIAQDGTIYVQNYNSLLAFRPRTPYGPLYTFDDYLDGTIPNYFANYRNQFTTTTPLAVTFTFTNENVNPQTIELGSSSNISIDITSTAGAISNAYVKIEGVNYTMTSLGGNKWKYDFVGTSLGIFDITNYYAEDSASNWGSATSDKSIKVIEGVGPRPTPRPTPTPTPSPTIPPLPPEPPTPPTIFDELLTLLSKILPFFLFILAAYLGASTSSYIMTEDLRNGEIALYGTVGWIIPLIINIFVRFPLDTFLISFVLFFIFGFSVFTILYDKEAIKMPKPRHYKGL